MLAKIGSRAIPMTVTHAVGSIIGVSVAGIDDSYTEVRIPNGSLYRCFIHAESNWLDDMIRAGISDLFVDRI